MQGVTFGMGLSSPPGLGGASIPAEPVVPSSPDTMSGRVFKTSDTTITSSTATIEDAELLINVGSGNTVILFEFMIFYTAESASSPDIGVGIYGPNITEVGSTMLGRPAISVHTATPVGLGPNTNTTIADSGTDVFSCFISGIGINNSTTGDHGVQYAATASNALGVTILAGSWSKSYVVPQ